MPSRKSNIDENKVKRDYYNVNDHNGQLFSILV